MSTLYISRISLFFSLSQITYIFVRFIKKRSSLHNIKHIFCSDGEVKL